MAANALGIGLKIFSYFYSLLPLVITTTEKVGADLQGHEKKQAAQDALQGIAQSVAQVAPQHGDTAQQAATAASGLIDGTVAMLNQLGVLKGADTVVVKPSAVSPVVSDAVQKATTAAVQGNDAQVSDAAVKSMTSETPSQSTTNAAGATNAGSGASTTGATSETPQTATQANSAQAENTDPLAEQISALEKQIADLRAQRASGVTTDSTGATQAGSVATDSNTGAQYKPAPVAFRQG